MLPSRIDAEQLLADAETCNPGPWGDHSRMAAYCAEQIARRCDGMDFEKAYILGLLHDIGRRFGVRHLGHVSDGFRYMMELGYDEAARINLTHSFNNHRIEEYVGKADTTDEEYRLIQTELSQITFDDYDRLIQLCDALAGNGCVLDIEERMADVKRRYGFYPQPKWDMNLYLLNYFRKKMGEDVYEVCDKELFHH